MSNPHITFSDNTTIPIRLAVLGDSNSHSYQDLYSFPVGSEFRGGPYRSTTLQWTEVLARLRAGELDLGPWGEWGQRKPLAQLGDLIGLRTRSPKKQDYLYNMAASGAGCDDLVVGVFRQAPRLAEMIREDPTAWQRGVIVIRMGINDIGTSKMLDLISVDPLAPAFLQRSDNCKSRIQQAIEILRGAQSGLKFVLVSPFNDTDDPNNRNKWTSAKEQVNLRRGFAVFADALRHMTQHDAKLHFMDECEWFRARWGGRNSDGVPDYKVVHVGDILKVANSVGDAPENTTLEDDHGGLVWNTLFAQSLVDEVNAAWDLGIRPLTESEVQEFVKSLIRK